MEDGVLTDNGNDYSKFVMSVKLPYDILEKIENNPHSVKFFYGNEPKLIIDNLEYSFSFTEQKQQTCILQQNNHYTNVGQVTKRLTCRESPLTMEDRQRIKINSTEAEKQRKERKTVFLGVDKSSMFILLSPHPSLPSY
ncbi:hypothetical protein ACTFIV_003587 [Dictyostelium citrinum]